MANPNRSKIKIERFTDDKGREGHRVYLNGLDISSSVGEVNITIRAFGDVTTKLVLIPRVELDLMSEVEYVTADEASDE